MGLILSLETATNVCSVALHKQGELLACSEVLIQKSHSQILTILSKEVVEKSGYNLNDLDAVAISSGPGSYTGLRIGTSTAKGLCFSLEIPLISVNTLEAMAVSVNMFNYTDSLVCPMLDARRMEVYSLVADSNNEIIQPTKAIVLDKDSFSNYLSAETVLFFGNGAEKFKKLLEGVRSAVFLDSIYPTARTVGQVAQRKFAKEDFENVIYFEPNYLKEFISTGLKK